MSRPTPERVAEGGESRWTVLELLRWTTGHFREWGIESARLDAECLLAHALGVERIRLYLDFEKPVSAPERAVFRELVLRRGRERVPVAHLTGRKEFWSLPLAAGPQALVPRPDTEFQNPSPSSNRCPFSVYLRLLATDSFFGSFATRAPRYCSAMPSRHARSHLP